MPLKMNLFAHLGGEGGGGDFVYQDFRPIEFDFAARDLIYLISLKLFVSKQKIRHLCMIAENF